MGSNTNFFGHEKTQMAGISLEMMQNLEIGDVDRCINLKETESSSYYIWQYFTVSISSDPKKGGAKFAACNFCEKTFIKLEQNMVDKDGKTKSFIKEQCSHEVIEGIFMNSNWV